MDQQLSLFYLELILLEMVYYTQCFEQSILNMPKLSVLHFKLQMSLHYVGRGSLVYASNIFFLLVVRTRLDGVLGQQGWFSKGTFQFSQWWGE